MKSIREDWSQHLEVPGKNQCCHPSRHDLDKLKIFVQYDSMFFNNNVVDIFRDISRLLYVFSGFPCGPPHQVSSLPWPVQQLPYQTVLHLQHPHHPTECARLQSLRYLTDAGDQVQWKLLGQFPRSLGCKCH